METQEAGSVGKARARRPGRPRKSEAQDTKAVLLQAAVALFAEKGYAGTSIRAIARAVGLSESVLYTHYRSKQAIFDAATELLGPASVASVLAHIDAGVTAQDPEPYLRQVCEDAIIAWDTEQARTYMSLVMREGLIHQQFLNNAIEGVIEMMAQRFAVWMEAGKVREDLGEPADLVYALMAPVIHTRMLGLHGAATQEQRTAARSRMRRHTEFFIRAIVASPTRRSPSEAVHAEITPPRP
jgi:AcrR family transcriptional regulator